MTARRQAALEKARSVVEVLPWLVRHHGRTMVIRLGGRVMTDPGLAASFAGDLVFLRQAGVRPVVVHGGGPRSAGETGRHGLPATPAAGLRPVPPRGPDPDADPDTVRMVLAGRVQRELVGLINRYGPLAVGMTGEDADTLTAVRRRPVPGGEPADPARSGRITGVRPGAVRALLADGRIPVLSPVARSAEDGGAHHVDTDAAAAALAVALGAQELILLTDVPGFCAGRPPGDEVIARLTAAELEKLLPDLSGATAARVSGCLEAVRGGVSGARVIDGRVPHSLLLPLYAEEAVGTVVVPDGDPVAP
ncbi:acetylglutamate kinase [Streptomyces sp. YIM 98790]|uniref:acetylglutamate kinase n=1 Tax=Streptomyces sp. YIM 98790 TaxID=2689077 RepID=UPI001407E4B5|nr:acetylglutamate kinase [Streptomyces sp. YIM 98790]